MKGDIFWFEDPKILINQERLSEFFPTDKMTLNEKLNAITRMSIYVGLVLLFLYQNSVYLLIPIFTMGFTYLIYQHNKNNEVHVNEKSILESEENDTVINPQELKEKFQTTQCVKPTPQNPFMNANLITDKRDREPACPYYDNVELAEDVDEKFSTNLYRDVSDLYGKNNNQRQYYTMPSTTIPNDQTSFARWCYLAPPTCKEDSIRCVPETVAPVQPHMDNNSLQLR